MATRSRSLQAVVAVLAALAAGCTQSPSLTDPEVFVGRFADDVSFQPFKNTSGSNVTPDATVCFPDTSLYCPDGGATAEGGRARPRGPEQLPSPAARWWPDCPATSPDSTP